MTVLTELRQELTDILSGTAGMNAVDHIPARINPPVVIVAAGNPYVEEVFDAKTFNHDYRVNMRLTLVASKAVNEAVTDELDAMITNTLIALQGMWEAEVGQPYQLEANGALYLAADVDIKTSITIA